MKARHSPKRDDGAALLRALSVRPKAGAKPGLTSFELTRVLGKHPSHVVTKLRDLARAGRLVVTRQLWPSDLDGAMRMHTFYRIKK